jgi:hypothetical protein
MLWRMSASLRSRSERGCRAEARRAKAGFASASYGSPSQPRARKLGVMSRHRVRKVCGKRPSRPAAGRHQLVPQPPSGSGNCANCPMALSARFPGLYYGTKEFPVAERPSCAISCRVVSEAGRSAEARIAGGAGFPRSLTLRTPIPRLPALCLSGPFRSELSARSADRGRVVPVLDRFSGRSPIAPFAPSFT